MNDKQSKLEQLRLEREEINRQLEELKKENKIKTILVRVLEWQRNLVTCYLMPPLFPVSQDFPVSQEKTLKKRLKDIDKQEQELLNKDKSKKGKEK